jgi:L-ascorbate metabolism protein UlaG (beta-lactamase superfamily)
MSRRAPLALAAALLALAGCCAFSGPRYRGPQSDHFDGERFSSVPPAHVVTVSEVVEWNLVRRPAPFASRIEDIERPPPPARVSGGRLRVTFVNHATALIQMDGLNILTDPIWSERASPVGWAGPRRVREPGVRFADLPPIDAVLISHNHYDHLDVPTLARLSREHRARIFVGLGNKALLEAAGVRGVFELDWWREAALGGGVRAVCVPSQHMSNRGICDRQATLFCSWALEGPSGRVYFAGDTGYGPHFREVGARLGPFRLALLPIGAYEPRWFMRPHHMGPDEAVRAHDDLGARTSVAIHYGTFDLGDESHLDPEVDLLTALARDAGAREVRRFWILAQGEGREVPALAR